MKAKDDFEITDLDEEGYDDFDLEEDAGSDAESDSEENDGQEDALDGEEQLAGDASEEEKKGSGKSGRIAANILIACALLCLVAAAVFLVKKVFEDKQAAESLEKLQTETATEAGVSAEPVKDDGLAQEQPGESQTTGTGEIGQNETAPDSNRPSDEDGGQTLTNPYAEYFAQNTDMAAWLSVPGTKIDYPVMQTPEDENYYLYLDFEKKQSKNGSLILDTDSSLNPIGTNLIIHGHNMKSGAMFGELQDYEDKDFYEDHKAMTLYTKECQRNYEVIAVFYTQVYKKTEDVFKFYKFFQADTEEEFLDYYDNIKALSLYDTGVTAEFGDRFLTLSTCSYQVENGRFVVVAKEVEPGDYYEPLEEN